MSSISSSLDNVISKLDSMTSEIVPKDYGEDIASKIDHVSKQLDYVTSGGVEYFIVHNGNIVDGVDCLDKTGREIIDAFTSGKMIVAMVDTDPFNQGDRDKFTIFEILNVFYNKSNDLETVVVQGTGYTQGWFNFYYGIDREPYDMSGYPAYIDQG